MADAKEVREWNRYIAAFKRRRAQRTQLMIRKTSKGYKVVSESGKNLSKPNLTKAGAEKRLREVEYFKHRGGKRATRRTKFGVCFYR